MLVLNVIAIHDNKIDENATIFIGLSSLKEEEFEFTVSDDENGNPYIRVYPRSGGMYVIKPWEMSVI